MLSLDEIRLHQSWLD